MKKIFYSELAKSTELNQFISNFMSMKQEMGNGVGAGKIIRENLYPFHQQDYKFLRHSFKFNEF